MLRSEALRRIPLIARLVGFARSRAGTAAVEFAFVFPIALLLYAGIAEVGDAVVTSRKVSTVTRTLDDLLSKQITSTQSTSTPVAPTALSAATLNTLLASSATLLYPKSTAPLTMTLTAVDIRNTSLGACCSATVRWSYTQNGTLRSCNGQASLPSQLLPTGTVLPQPVSILVAEASYTYQPTFAASLIPFSPVMKRVEYMMPRTTGQVLTGTLPSSGTQYGQVCY